jgi:hypothetical protein
MARRIESSKLARIRDFNNARPVDRIRESHTDRVVLDQVGVPTTIFSRIDIEIAIAQNEANPY